MVCSVILSEKGGYIYCLPSSSVYRLYVLRLSELRTISLSLHLSLYLSLSLFSDPPPHAYCDRGVCNSAIREPNQSALLLTPLKVKAERSCGALSSLIQICV